VLKHFIAFQQYDHTILSISELAGLYSALVEYQDRVQKLISEGRLHRILLHSRLQRALEECNCTLAMRLESLLRAFRAHEREKKLRQGPGGGGGGGGGGVANNAEEMQLARRTFKLLREQHERESLGRIEDSEGRRFWMNSFGSGCLVVSWARFLPALQACLGVRSQHSESEAQLRIACDPASSGFVELSRFASMLRAFGPMSRFLANLRDLFRREWFCGHLSAGEAELLLLHHEAHPPGTFLVRFSRSRAALAIALATESGVRHVQVECLYGRLRVQIRAEEGPREFPSWDALLGEFGPSLLQRPFAACSLVREPYFAGELSSEEACELLRGLPAGAFLLRFSKKRLAFALAYVRDATVCHALVRLAPDPRARAWCVELEPAGALGPAAPSLQQLIRAYAHILTLPYRTALQLSLLPSQSPSVPHSASHAPDAYSPAPPPSAATTTSFTTTSPSSSSSSSSSSSKTSSNTITSLRLSALSGMPGPRNAAGPDTPAQPSSPPRADPWSGPSSPRGQAGPMISPRSRLGLQRIKPTANPAPT
jgi:hypothetical protein